ncbi:Uncharacterised protein [Vibrio cholerae]|nr:Uncharacterised protein [Vibrio cholerae]
MRKRLGVHLIGKILAIDAYTLVIANQVRRTVHANGITRLQ